MLKIPLGNEQQLTYARKLEHQKTILYLKQVHADTTQLHHLQLFWFIPPKVVEILATSAFSKEMENAFSDLGSFDIWWLYFFCIQKKRQTFP